MCGIVGILNLNHQPADPEILTLMTDALSHRGPDGEGVWTDGNLGLGHRRLAIIDLSSRGHQPMLDEQENYAIVYNGEIYNHPGIRQELQNRGHRFRSRTDTEVVLHAYMEWGEDCVRRFNGMFALAIWDRKRQELFLARDRYGIKPLYYYFDNRRFLFASEQKGILACPRVQREPDLEALLEYFTFQNLFTDRTLLKGIRVFPPACWARLSTEKADLIPMQYWDFDFREPEKYRREEEYREELSFLFRQAVQRQLISDVEVGAYLSGGMDSGAITAIAAEEFPYIKSFTCGFDLHSVSGLELGFDERERAELMSYLFKTEHYEMVLKAGDLERILPELAWHLEEPRVGQSYPNFYVARLASRFVKVVLSGTGGDEIFGGYPWRYYRAMINSSFEDYLDKYYEFWQRLIPEEEISRVFAPVWKHVRHLSTRDIFKGVFKQHPHHMEKPEDYVNHSMYFEARTFLHGLLIVEDKISMSQGLESRLPFLDNDLVEFGMRLPLNLKLRNVQEIVRLNENEPGPKTRKYFQKTNDGKLLLRQMMEGYVPPEIHQAEKQGFSAPDASWFRGESIDYVRRILFDDNARIYQFLDRGAVQNLLNKHLSGRENYRLFIWSLLNFEWWCRKYI